MTKQTLLKKQILLILIFILFLPLGLMTVVAEANVLDEVVVLETKGDYDEVAAEEMKQRIGTIHIGFLNALAREDIVIKLINFPLTELEEYTFLKGVVPRGWENTGYTWDDVPGAGGDPTVAKIGHSDPLPENFHDTLNLELHEIAHAIDQFVLNDISFGAEFMAIHAAEQPYFLPDVYFEYPEEYFAEVFAYYYLNEEMRSVLKEQAPETFAFIANLPKKIPDTLPPELTLNGPTHLEIKSKDDYEEAGATATDGIFGDLSDQIVIEGEVDSGIPGEYELLYYVVNEADQSATARRIVTIIKSQIKDYQAYQKDLLNFIQGTPGELRRIE